MRYRVSTKEEHLTLPGVGWGEVVRGGLPEEVSQRLRQEG